MTHTEDLPPHMCKSTSPFSHATLKNRDTVPTYHGAGGPGPGRQAGRQVRHHEAESIGFHGSESLGRRGGRTVGQRCPNWHLTVDPGSPRTRKRSSQTIPSRALPRDLGHPGRGSGRTGLANRDRGDGRLSLIAGRLPLHLKEGLITCRLKR